MLIYYLYNYGPDFIIAVGFLVGVIIVVGRGKTKKSAVIDMLNQANDTGKEITGMKREK